MKNFSLKSTFAFALLAIAGVTFLGSGNKAFAYTDAQRTGAFNPNPSVCTSLVVDRTLNAGNLAAGAVLADNTIYVVPAGTYAITGNIDMGNCSVLVADADTAGNVVFNFTGGAYISAIGKSNFSIVGYDATHKIVISGPTSPFGIALQDSYGAKVSYTTLSGFTSLGGIVLSNTSGSTLSYNTINNNLDGIRLQNTSTNNTITNNTVNYNTNHGIWLDPGSDNTTVSNNTLDHNLYGLFVDASINVTGSTNNIHDNTVGLYLNTLSNNIISSNTVNNNSLGIYLDNAQSNTFSNNVVSNNTNVGISLQAGCSNNVFNGGSVTASNINIELISADSNQFNNITTQGGQEGISMTTSDSNIFSGTTVTSNTHGVTLTTSSNNTFKLTNNTNGISLYAGSDGNNILNTQVLGQNNIAIYNGSNNIITGGLFAVASTTSTSVNITLTNHQTTPTYSVGGAGLSGTYTGSMTTSSQTLAITLTAGTGVKDIFVTYNNGNIQYHTVTLSTVTPPPSGGGGGGGGGLPTCTSSQLVCTNGVRTAITGGSCQGGNLGLSCSIGTGGTGGSIEGSTYSDELNNAYLRAYSFGITTMPTIQQANMGGTLIRAHMAKMISNFAVRVAGRTPDTNRECDFADIGNESTELKFYIKLSCQLGLMGLQSNGTPDTVFNPRSEVTRSQFGTVLSRLIRGDTYNGGTPYYAPHLNALKAAGIMTQITNPSLRKELRGYVMLMMQRTYEGGYLSGSN